MRRIRSREVADQIVRLVERLVEDDDGICYCGDLLEEEQPCEPCRAWQARKIREARERIAQRPDVPAQKCPF
jgi:hypothetical protein